MTQHWLCPACSFLLPITSGPLWPPAPAGGRQGAAPCPPECIPPGVPSPMVQGCHPCQLPGDASWAPLPHHAQLGDSTVPQPGTRSGPGTRLQGSSPPSAPLPLCQRLHVGPAGLPVVPAALSPCRAMPVLPGRLALGGWELLLLFYNQKDLGGEQRGLHWPRCSASCSPARCHTGECPPTPQCSWSRVGAPRHLPMPAAVAAHTVTP